MFRRPVPPPQGPEPADLREGEVLLLDPERRFLRPRGRTLLLGALLLGGALAGAAWLVLRPTPEERVRGLVDLARTELAADHAETAVRLLEEAVLLDPRSAEAHYLLGLARIHAGRSEDGVASLRASLAVRPRHAGAAAALARILVTRGDVDEAIRLLDAAVESAGPDGAPYGVRAEARLARGDLGGAFSDLTSALEGGRDADAATTCLLAAHLADFLGRTTRDESLLRAADDLVRRIPALAASRDGVSAAVLAEAHLAAGRTRTALAILRDAPPGPAVAVLRAEAHRLDGAPNDAETVLRDEIGRADAPAVRAALVRLLASESRVRAATLELGEAERRFPGDAGIAHAGIVLGRVATAGAAPGDLLAAVLRPDPAVFNPAEPLFTDRVLRRAEGPLAARAALVLRGLAALSDAGTEPAPSAAAADLISRVGEILAAAPDDPDARLWRGALRLRRGDAEGARDDLDVAVAAGAAAGRARLVRALALGVSGRWAAALEDVRSAAGTSPADPAAAAVEVHVWLGLGDRESAVAAARRAAARWPDDVHVLCQLAAALAPGDGAPADAAAERERGWIRTRLALASPDTAERRDAVRTLADAAGRDDAASAALAAWWDEAAAEWAERERRDPADLRAPVAHAESLVRAGRPRRAEDVLRRAVERNPAPALVTAHARALVRLGAYDAAVAALRPLAAANPGDLRIELELASVRAAAGDEEAATAALRRIVRAEDAPPDVRADAAIALVSAESVDAEDARAVLAWLASPASAPLEFGARRLLEGHARLALGDAGAAVASGDEVLRAQRGRSRAAVLTARGWLADGRADRAEEVLSRALAESPGEPVVANLASHVRLVLGLRALDAGDRAAAASWWEAAFTGSDLDTLAAAALADLQIRSRDPGAVSAAAARILVRRPGSAAASLLRGRAEDARGRSAVARADLREAVSRAPAHVATVSAFVESSVRAGDLDAAERACRRAIDAGDRLGLVHALLAFVLDRRGDEAGAEAAWREAVRRDPSNYGAVAELAQRLARSGRAAEARDLVASARAQAAAPSGAEERFARLRAYVETGPAAGSIDRLREVLTGAPRAWQSSLALGRALAVTGDVAGAVPWFEEASAAAPGAIEPRALLVRAFAELGRLDEAEARLAARTSERADDAGAWNLLAMIAAHRGRPALAEQHCRRALAADPRDALAANNLAVAVFEQEGRRAEALSLVERAAHERPEVPHLAATRGWMLLNDGQPAAALAVLDEAVRTHPGFALARLHRAEAYFALGRTDAAVAELRAAERIEPGISGRASAALRGALPR